MNEANKRWFTKKELALRWQCCTKTIERMEHEGKLTPVYISERLKRYSNETVEQAERTGAVS